MAASAENRPNDMKTCEVTSLEPALDMIKTPFGPEKLRIAIRKLGNGGAKKVASLLQYKRHADESTDIDAAGHSTTAKPLLRVLELWSTSIGVSGAKDFEAALTSGLCTLTKLDLNWNPLIGDEGACSLFNGLSSGHWKLKTLCLGGCDIGDAGAQALSDALEKGATNDLNELVLCGNRIQGEGATAIGAALSFPNNCLTLLDLKVNPIGDAGASSIFTALHSECCKIETLDLENCNLGPESTVKLASALRSEHCKLKRLSLNRNDPGVGDAGCKRLGAALKADYKHPILLHELNLCRNNISTSGAVDISEAVGLEDSLLEKIWLLANPFSETQESMQMVASGFYGELKLRKSPSPLKEVAGVELWMGLVGGQKMRNRDVLVKIRAECGKSTLKRESEAESNLAAEKEADASASNDPPGGPPGR